MSFVFSNKGAQFEDVSAKFISDLLLVLEEVEGGHGEEAVEWDHIL